MCEKNCIEIDTELFKKLLEFSKIAGISLTAIANDELGDFINYIVKEEPYLVLDRFLGIETIANPFEIVKKLKELLGYSDEEMKFWGSSDPIEYVKDWGHPLK